MPSAVKDNVINIFICLVLVYFGVLCNVIRFILNGTHFLWDKNLSLYFIRLNIMHAEEGWEGASEHR